MDKKISLPIYAFALLLITSLSSCDLLAGIFKGGVYVGVILVIIVVALIFWLVRSTRK